MEATRRVTLEEAVKLAQMDLSPFSVSFTAINPEDKEATLFKSVELSFYKGMFFFDYEGEAYMMKDAERITATIKGE